MSISFKKVSHFYSEGTPFAFRALEAIDLDLCEGKITAVIGATGSGKSTLVQHLNALLLPSEGEVSVSGYTIKAKEKFKEVKALRKNVGLVFQFAEYQLFEETLVKDVAFGPKNFGATEEEATKLAMEALKTVGMDPSDFEKSPLELSGGQKRRVAIAGILAMKPQVLVLDEPTAGLDPQGAKDMMSLFKKVNKENGTTVIMVTHNMDHVMDYCDNVVVMENGKVICNSSVDDFFEDPSYMQRAKIDPPMIVQFKQLCLANGVDLGKDVLSVEQLADVIAKRCKK